MTEKRKQAAIDAAKALVRAAQSYDGPETFVDIARMWLSDLDRHQLVTVAVEVAAVLSVLFGDPFTDAGQRAADDIEVWLRGK